MNALSWTACNDLLGPWFTQSNQETLNSNLIRPI